MASASSFLSEEHVLCCICLDVFTDPVSIPCGHNFCKSCIIRHWGDKQQYQCPLCKEWFNSELKLCINTAFREIVEDFKKHSQETLCDTSQFLVQPGQVPCDCCPDNKFRASKTCLVCLASYCKLHLEPHERVEALKRHTLTDPVLNLEDKICVKHNRILELFCRNDQTCICVLCTDHSDHDTVPLEKAFANKKSHMRKKKLTLKAKNSGKKAQKTKAGELPMRKDDTTLSNVVSNQLQAPHIWQFPNGGQHDFNIYPYDKRNCGFSQHGFSYSFDIRHGVGWNLKVMIESVSGKTAFAQIDQNGPCIIKCHNNFGASQNKLVHLVLIKTPEGMSVFLDYETDLLSFHDQETDILIYSITGSKFIERIFFCFIPYTTEIDTRGLLKMVQKMKVCLHISSNSYCLNFLVFVFLCFILFMFVYYLI